MDLNTQFLESPLVLWIRTFAGAAAADLMDLVDGLLLNKIMTEIDPTFFGMSFVHSSVYGDINLRVHNLEHLLRSLKNFYQEKLQQVIVLNPPNIFAIANEPESDGSLQELNKIFLLILGCAVQCERKEFFIEKITSMNESIQQELVLRIKEAFETTAEEIFRERAVSVNLPGKTPAAGSPPSRIILFTISDRKSFHNGFQITENCDTVFAFQPNEIAAFSHEELLSYCEVMYDQMIKLVNQRDFNAEEIQRLLVDGVYPTKEVNGNIRRISSPPLSPTNPDMVLADRAKFRQVTEELDEKNVMIQELKDELESNKLISERLLQENQNLAETSRWVNAYRDQLDVLKIKAEKASKLESDVFKYKEKLHEMDAVKKRTEELEEQNEILYNTKVVLVKQVDTLTTKAERLGETEREVLRLRKNIKALTEERIVLETRHQDVLQENARLSLDAQNSLSEVSSLSSELDMFKDKDKEETGTCLANEYNQISSTKLLRLEHENHRLKVLIGELTQHNAVAVPQTVVAENEVENVTYEQTTSGDEIREDPEVVKSLTSVTKALSSKETELTTIQEKLKKKEDYANMVSESLSVKEQENSELQDRIQQVMNQKRRTDQLIHRKNEDVAELERRLEEVVADRQKSEENIRKKSREINELTNSLVELKEDKERSIEAVEKKTKDVTELKERFGVLLSEKETLADNCTVKDKRVTDLENRLQRLEDANKDLAETLESKREKILSQEKRVNELITSAKEEERRYFEIVREKDSRLKEFERKLADLIEMESELDTLNSQIKLKDRKSDGFLKTIQQKDQEIVELENRLEDAETNSNKLQYNLELKEKKMDSLEQRLLKAESKEEKRESNEDKASREVLEKRDDKILELESRLEDALNSSKKLQHTLKVKDEKIVTLETRLEEAQVVESERNRLARLFDEKKKRIAELESRIEEADTQNRKLAHNVKIKEDRIASLGESVLELEELTNQNQKLKQIIQQKEDKIHSMEEKVDEYEESTRKCDRLTQKVMEREESVRTLNERLTELETHGINNEKLNKAISQKDERIKFLESSLEDVQLKCTQLENDMAKVQHKYEEKVKRSLQDVDIHKVRRQESVKRREDQIRSLEISRSKLETVLQSQEGHIQTLQDRLEGSVTERNKLGSSISKKESTIQQLQTKILELEEATTETRKLNGTIRIKDETIKRFEDRVREIELVLSRAKSSNCDKDEKIEELQKRIEECAALNKKIDIKLKKKDETLLKTERDLLKLENRDKGLQNCVEKNSQHLEEQKTSPRSLTPRVEDTKKVQTLRQKLWEAEAKVEETENEKGKLQHQIERRETQIQELEKRLEVSTDALEENERLKKNIKHKEERVRILQVGLEQNQKEINSLESRLESSTSEIYKLRKTDDEKRKRIDSFKMKLENSDGVQQTLTRKEERIQTLEERNGELERKNSYLNKRLISLEAELENIRDKKGSAETIIVNTSPKHRQDVTCVKLGNREDIKILNEKIADVEKRNEELCLEKENIASRCEALIAEKESLTRELERLRSDHDQLLNDVNELKESYTELDLSSAKSLHRCEMLTQMNSTLEEENRMLMEQMNRLLTQNQELLTESLVSRDQFMEEERTFSDRLYELRRQKEKLEEKIEQANKSLAENTPPKKKSNLFKKVLQKAGLKKKKDETMKSKSVVQLIKYDHSPNGTEGSSDVSVESGASFQGVYPMSPERASDSSNFSEGPNSDNSPERDLSPLARKRGRINRAHRSRVARSEYLAPAMMNSLATQGRSRSLDAREFIREVVQAQHTKPEQTAALVTSNSMGVIRNDASPSDVDGSRQLSRHSQQVSRTQSFNLGSRDNDSGTPVHMRKKSVENKTEVTKALVNSSPESAVTRDAVSTSSKTITGQQTTPVNIRKVSDSSRKSSEVSSSHSRSSSLCSAETSSDTSKTTVRHIGSSPRDSMAGHASTLASEVAKKNFVNGGKNDNKENRVADELRLSLGSADNTKSENQKHVSRRQTPSPPPRMSVAADASNIETPPSVFSVENGERVRDKLPTKRSSSFCERPQSLLVPRSQVQRQNSDRVFVSSMEIERKNILHSEPSPTSLAPDTQRRPLSVAQRAPSTSGTHVERATGPSIGIVSFKEVPRIQSAVLESSPQLERKQRADVEVNKSGPPDVDTNTKKEPSVDPSPRGPQTPKMLRRVPKHKNLSFDGSSSTPKNKRAAENSLWLEYGEV